MRAQSHFRLSAGQIVARCLLAALILGPVSAVSGASIPHPHHRQPKQIVHEIETLEQQLQQAELNANTTAIANLLSDDYLGIDGDGSLVTKADTLVGFKDGSVHFTALNTSDRKIRVYGATVVVVSRAHVIGMHNGKSIDGHYRYTRVYHRSNGVWKVVSFEASRIHDRDHGHNH